MFLCIKLSYSSYYLNLTKAKNIPIQPEAIVKRSLKTHLNYTSYSSRTALLDLIEVFLIFPALKSL